ncbi:NUDIX hydrolase [Candidatus Parcubacteria bacterium]|nr:NUDIX hydrolase [Candidatus Parcubacteria bacterium]
MKKIQLSGCAIIKDGKLLTLWKKRHKHYEFPGGGVEGDETLEQTALREVKEEIGCDAQLGKYIGCKEFFIDGKHYQSHKFLAIIKEDCQPQIQETDKFDHIFWLPIKEYEKYSVAPNVKKHCEDVIQGKLKL